MSVNKTSFRLWLAIFCYLLLLIGLLWYDRQPDQALEQFIATAQPANIADADNLYFVLAGFNSSPGSDPVSYGKQRTRDAKHAHSVNRIAPEAADSFSLQGKLPQQLLDRSTGVLQIAAGQRQQVQKLLQDNRMLLERYRSLRNYKAYAEPLDLGYDLPLLPRYPSRSASATGLLEELALSKLGINEARVSLGFGAPPLQPAGAKGYPPQSWYSYPASPPLKALDTARRLQLLKLAVQATDRQPEAAVQELAEENRFWKQLAAATAILPVKLLALDALQDNLLLASELVAANLLKPVNQPVLHTLLQPFEPQVYSFGRVFSGELYLLRSELKQVARESQFLKPNDTLQRYLPAPHELARYGTMDAAAFAAAYPGLQAAIAAAEKRHIGLWALYNPAALFIRPAPLYLATYQLRGHNLEALRRMVAVQTRLKAAGTPSDGMPEQLQQLGQTFGNPYTGKPFDWNPQQQSIWMRDPLGVELRIHKTN